MKKNMRAGEYEDVGKPIFQWFLAKRSQNVPIDWVLLKEKTLDFAKQLGQLDFKASDCWLSKWNTRLA